MKTKAKRILSSLLATMTLGQSFFCNPTIITSLTAKADEPEVGLSDNLNASVSDMTISGYVGLEDNRTAEITVLIFDDNWNTIAETKVDSGQYFSVSALDVRSNSATTHVKIECNGYLPRFYKDMGFGSYQLGTADNPEILYFGDTTYNPDADNQWSDEVINENDLTFVNDQKGKRRGDETYDERYDLNQDGVIDGSDADVIAGYYGHTIVDGALIDPEGYFILGGEFIIDMDLNEDHVIDADDSNYLLWQYPEPTYQGDEDFEQFSYMDINGNDLIDEADCQYFADYIEQHHGHNPYNDYLYHLILTGDCYHDGAMYLENTNLDLAEYDLVVNGNFVFRTQNPYHPMWGDTAGVTLHINAGTLYIADQFDFGQANSYDKIVMTNENGKLYVNGIWNYITLADMEGLWTAGNIYFFGSTWQVNEASGDKSIYSTGTHSICFYYQYGQQVIRWANTQDCIYNEDTGEYNTLRRFNFDYQDSAGNCLGVTFPCGYSDERYYFRASLPEEITQQNTSTTIPYEDWELLNDDDNNTIPDIVDTQIKNENYAAISNAWLEDNYGDVIDEFVVNEASFSIDDLNNNKKHFIDFLYYLQNTYDKNSEDYEKAIQLLEALHDALEQIVLGDYTDKVTILGTVGQIIISVIPTGVTQAIDFIFDLRDLSENIIHPNIEDSDWWLDLTLDVIAVIPEFGTSIKQIKHLDSLTNLKGLSKFIFHKINHIIFDKDGKLITKNADEVKKIVKLLTDDIETLKGLSKEINELIEIKGAENVFDFYFQYGIKALEIIAKNPKYYDEIVNMLSKYEKYYDEIIDIIKDVSDIAKVINFINIYKENGILILCEYMDDSEENNIINIIDTIAKMHPQLDKYAETESAKLNKKVRFHGMVCVVADVTSKENNLYFAYSGIKKMNNSIYLDESDKIIDRLEWEKSYVYLLSEEHINEMAVEDEIKEELKKLSQCIKNTATLAEKEEKYFYEQTETYSFELHRCVENCAEVWAARNAILHGAKLENLIFRAEFISGEHTYNDPCGNCRRTFADNWICDDSTSKLERAENLNQE